MNEVLAVILWYGIYVVLNLAYGVPMIVAAKRSHPQVDPIAIVNMLLGWTVIAWIVCLAWAVSTPQRTINP